MNYTKLSVSIQQVVYANHVQVAVKIVELRLLKLGTLLLGAYVATSTHPPQADRDCVEVESKFSCYIFRCCRLYDVMPSIGNSFC